MPDRGRLDDIANPLCVGDCGRSVASQEAVGEEWQMHFDADGKIDAVMCPACTVAMRSAPGRNGH